MSTPTTVRAVANFNDGAKVGTVTFQQEVSVDIKIFPSLVHPVMFSFLKA